MLKRHSWILSIAFVFGMPVVALACLWDYDTLSQERARFPSTLELITGKFLRHSKEFYEWRIKDRLAKIKSSPEKVYYLDDLAVAYEKTGQHEKAIQTLLEKEKIRPGLYETYSNLGTVHILAGNFEEGLPYIDKALAINPDAHFGRERYQKWLVEYLLERRKQGVKGFPLHQSTEYKDTVSENFAGYIALKFPEGKTRLDLPEAQKAVTGVLGMMRFANHDNPLLLEALGDLLLIANYNSQDAKRLAARAYLMASRQFDDPAVKNAYRECAGSALSMQTRSPSSQDRITLSEVEGELNTELLGAQKWYASLKTRELAWIREGKDADVEFDHLYSDEIPPIPEKFHGIMYYIDSRYLTLIVTVVFFLTLYFVVRRQFKTGGRARK